MAFLLPKTTCVKFDKYFNDIRQLFTGSYFKREKRDFSYRITAIITVVALLGTVPAALINSRAEYVEAGYDAAAAADSVSRGDISRSDLELMSRVIEGEAADEPFEGKIAVAAVIINRVENDEFPDSIRTVLYEPLAFEAVANGQYTRPLSEDSMQAAKIALEGYDPTDGALYYWNPDKVKKSSWIWRKPVSKRIGRHVFAH